MFFGEDLKGLFVTTGDQTTNVKESVQKVDLKSTIDNANSRSSNGGGGGQNP